MDGDFMIKGLPEKLKDLRLKYKLSQRQVAKMTRLSPSLISAYENGDRTPNLENILAFSELYKCSVDYLLGKQKEIFVLKDNKIVLNDEQSIALSRFISLIKAN